MTIERRYKVHYLVDVIKKLQKSFEFIINSESVTPTLNDTAADELRQLCATNAETQEGQPEASVNPSKVVIISVDQVESKEVI